MKSVILIGVLVFSSFASADPISCFEAASQDRVIKWSDDLKSTLCRKATSIAPYECFAYAYTNNSDFKIMSSGAIQLCQGAVTEKAPYDCFVRAIELFQGQNYITAIRFCSGTTDADKAISCFTEVQKKFGLSKDDAAELCAQ